MPCTVAMPVPFGPASTSVWYQDVPNGLFGTSITNRSNSALAGMPWTETTIVSFCLCGKIATVPPACGRQDEMPGDSCSGNTNGAPEMLPLACTSGLDVAAPAAPIASAEAAPMLAATVITRQEKRSGIRLNFMTV